MLRKYTYFLLVTPTLIYLIMFWFVPLLNVLTISFTERDTYIIGNPVYVGFKNYFRIASDYVSTIRNTILFPLAAAFIDLLVGFPLAYLLVRRKVLFTNLIRASLIFPYFGDIYVSYGLWNMFLPGGLFDYFYEITGISYREILYRPQAVIMGFSIFTLPFMVLYASSSLVEIDETIEHAALTLGATPVKTFFKVVLPLAAPGVIAGFIACFGWNLGGYLIPLLLGGVESSNVMTVRIVELSLRIHEYGVASALAIVLIAITIFSTYLTFKITKALE